jgi:peptidyl-prolyl cis-trans isomerase B (cyclophilin B)
MNRRIFTFSTVSAAAGLLTACGGNARSNAAPNTSNPGNKIAVVELDKGGSFTMELFGGGPANLAAPKTVENFVAKANAGFYNGLVFHRVEDWVVQGGDPRGNGTGGGSMPTELNEKPFVVGSVGVARGPDIRISNDSQFFVCLKPAEWLNRQYTNFGQVTEGMDAVRKIVAQDKIKKITIKG